MYPPHLPAKVENSKRKNNYNFLSWTLFIIVISALSSLAASLTTIVYLAPSLVSSEIIMPFVTKRDSRLVTDPTIINQTRQRFLSVYDSTKKINKSFFTKDAFVGEAIILSSDGWSVFHYPKYVTEKKKLEGVDYRGYSYAAEKEVYDPLSQLLYIKFKGDGFRVMPFLSLENTKINTPYWRVNFEEWNTVMLENSLIESGSKNMLLPTWRTVDKFRLSEADGGELVLDERGEFIGFAKENGDLVLNWLISNQLGNVLERGIVQYSAISAEGYFVYGVVSDVISKKYTGWYVVNSPSNVSTSTISKGDVIVSINQTLVTERDFARQILVAESPINITVIRNKTEVDLIIPKQIIKDSVLMKR